MDHLGPYRWTLNWPGSKVSQECCTPPNFSKSGVRADFDMLRTKQVIILPTIHLVLFNLWTSQNASPFSHPCVLSTSLLPVWHVCSRNLSLSDPELVLPTIHLVLFNRWTSQNASPLELVLCSIDSTNCQIRSPLEASRCHANHQDKLWKPQTINNIRTFGWQHLAERDQSKHKTIPRIFEFKLWRLFS